MLDGNLSKDEVRARAAPPTTWFKSELFRWILIIAVFVLALSLLA